MKKSGLLLSFIVILSGSIFFFFVLFPSRDVPDPQTFFRDVLQPFETAGLYFSDAFSSLMTGLDALTNFFSDPDLSDVINLFELFALPFKALAYVVKLLFDILNSISSLV